jgi:hypothetical protein
MPTLVEGEEMQAQTWKQVRTLAWAIGLAAALTALLLVWAAEQAPALQAMTVASPGAPAEPGAGTRFDGVVPAWGSTEPVTIFVPDNRDSYWDLSPQYSVVISFPRHAFSWSKGAVFTFTPRSDLKLDPSWVSLPYFFDLDGVYVGLEGKVSLHNPIEINMGYREEDLGDVLEESLEAFWFDERPDPREWILLGATPIPAQNRLTWATKYLGPFGIGGRRLTMIYLPTVMR